MLNRKQKAVMQTLAFLGEATVAELLMFNASPDTAHTLRRRGKILGEKRPNPRARPTWVFWLAPKEK